jgi:hypothetical protein
MKLDKNVTKNSTLNFADIQEAPATQRIPHWNTISNIFVHSLKKILVQSPVQLVALFTSILYVLIFNLASVNRIHLFAPVFMRQNLKVAKDKSARNQNAITSPLHLWLQFCWYQVQSIWFLLNILL